MARSPFPPLLFFMLCLVPFAFAAEIDLTRVHLTSPNGVDHVRPSDTLRLDFKVENTAGEALEDITVSAVFRSSREGLLRDEDNDVLNLSTNVNSLRTGTAAERSITFRVPYTVRDTDQYQLELTTTGYTVNRSAFRSMISANRFTVDKLPHELRFELLTLSQATVQCGQDAELSLVVRNIGNDNEDVQLIIRQQDLGLAMQDSFSLQRDYSKNNTYAKQVRFTVPTIPAGAYTIPVVVRYNRDASTLQNDLSLTVNCDAPVLPEEPVTIPEIPSETPPETPPEISPGSAPIPPTPAPQPAEQPPISPPTASNWMLIIGLTIGGIIVAALLFLILYRLWKVRRIIG